MMLLSREMKRVLSALLLVPFSAWRRRRKKRGRIDVHAAERFARLALACVNKEYPNHISHVLNSEADVAAPCKLTPAFCGCYDWHSSVHGHWLLARLARTFPDATFTPAAREAWNGA